MENKKVSKEAENGADEVVEATNIKLIQESKKERFKVVEVDQNISGNDLLKVKKMMSGDKYDYDFIEAVAGILHLKARFDGNQLPLEEILEMPATFLSEVGNSIPYATLRMILAT